MGENMDSKLQLHVPKKSFLDTSHLDKFWMFSFFSLEAWWYPQVTKTFSFCS